MSNTPSSGVWALHVYDDGGGPALYVGGIGLIAPGATSTGVVRWNGVGWGSLGAGLSGSNGCRLCPGSAVFAMAVFDGGEGERLYVGGDFLNAGPPSTNGSIAAWDGTRWHDVGGVLAWTCVDCAATVTAMAAFNDGFGHSLYILGHFEQVGSVLAQGIARWDGVSWHRPGNVRASTIGVIYHVSGAMEVFQDAEGPALYIGGQFAFDAGSGQFDWTSPVRWDGQALTIGGGGTNPHAPQGELPGLRTFKVFDDGGGGSLYVAGAIDRAGELPVRNIARWDGKEWHDVGGGIDRPIYAMTVFDDGSGPALYVGGSFTEAGGVPANNLAKWDGKAWSALGEGTNGAVRALAVWDRDGEGPEPPGLYVGGEFTMAGGIPSPYIAKWQGCAAPACYADCDTSTGPGILDIFDFLCFGNRFAVNDPYACDCDTSTGPGICDIFDFLCFGNAFNKGCS